MAFIEVSHPATDFEEMGNVLFHNKQDRRCYLNKNIFVLLGKNVKVVQGGEEKLLKNG